MEPPVSRSLVRRRSNGRKATLDTYVICCISTTTLYTPNWVTASNAVTVNAAVVTNSAPSGYFRLLAQPNPTAGMVLIPAGSFRMGNYLVYGAPTTDQALADANPTNIALSAFYMDTNLTSFSQWQSVYSYATNHGYSFAHAGSGKGANHPVQTVDWYDCVKWSNARSQQQGLTPVYYTDAGLTQVYTNGEVTTLYPNWAANGYRLTVGRETAGQAAPAPATGASAVYGRFSYLVGPDGVKVELVTNTEPNAPPIMHHHVHFVNKQYVEMQQWYMKALNATLRPGQTDFFIGADVPGVGYMLNFFRWELEENLTGTAGRAIDHVGFEVKNLEEFCRQLEAKGIKLTTPYRKAPELNNIGTATVIDPWGTVIELTEGLNEVS